MQLLKLEVNLITMYSVKIKIESKEAMHWHLGTYWHRKCIRNGQCSQICSQNGSNLRFLDLYSDIFNDVASQELEQLPNTTDKFCLQCFIPRAHHDVVSWLTPRVTV